MSKYLCSMHLFPQHALTGNSKTFIQTKQMRVNHPFLWEQCRIKVSKVYGINSWSVGALYPPKKKSSLEWFGCSDSGRMHSSQPAAKKSLTIYQLLSFIGFIQQQGTQHSHGLAHHFPNQQLPCGGQQIIGIPTQSQQFNTKHPGFAYGTATT